MSTEQKAAKEFDSHKYVALVYDHHGIARNHLASNSLDEVVKLALEGYTTAVGVAHINGDDPGAPIWETYIRLRDSTKLVVEAYNKDLTDGRGDK